MFGDLFETVGGWIDTGVDYVAELVGYEGSDFIDITGETFSAGDQLTDDVLGFIRGEQVLTQDQKKEWERNQDIKVHQNTEKLDSIRDQDMVVANQKQVVRRIHHQLQVELDTVIQKYKRH